MADPEVIRLLSEAAEWRLLGLLFEYPSDSWRSQVQALAGDLQDESLRKLASAALENASEGLHIALFGPAGSVPVREVTYLGGVQFGYLMAELAAFYDAFGYRPGIEEADDHLAVEAGFLAYLKMKEAFAAANGDAESSAVTSEAATSFLKEHLALMAEPVAVALANFAPDYLAHAGQIILKHAGSSPRGSYPLAAPLNEDETEVMSCSPSASVQDLIQLEP